MHQGSKIALVSSYLRVPQAAGQVKNWIFLVKIYFFPCANIFCDAGQVHILRNYEGCACAFIRINTVFLIWKQNQYCFAYIFSCSGPDMIRHLIRGGGARGGGWGSLHRGLYTYMKATGISVPCNLAQGSHTPFWEWGRGPWNWENQRRFD